MIRFVHVIVLLALLYVFPNYLFYYLKIFVYACACTNAYVHACACSCAYACAYAYAYVYAWVQTQSGNQGNQGKRLFYKYQGKPRNIRESLEKKVRNQRKLREV